MATQTATPRTPVAPRGKLALRADWKPGEFEVVIAQQGYRVLWEQASRCPCLQNAQTGQAALDCPTCRSSGWEYHTPLEIRAILDRLDNRIDVLGALGEWAFGSATITVRGEHRPGYWDRYTLLDSVLTTSEVTVRRAAAGGRERLTYPIATVRMDLLVANEAGDLVRRFNYPVNVERLRCMDPATGHPGAVLRRDVDFFVTEAGDIDWAPGDVRRTAPAEGGAFAVTYMRHPRYRVVESPFAIREGHARTKDAPDGGSSALRWVMLPVTVLAKLDYDSGEVASRRGT